MQGALTALDLPPDSNNKPQLLRNHTGILITKLLQAMHCAERTETSQDICDKVMPILLMLSSIILLQFEQLLRLYAMIFF